METTLKFKVGDRVYFYYDITDVCSGVGTIARVYDEETTFPGYGVHKDGEAEGSDYFVEPDNGEILIPEELYNSPLYKALR